MVLSKASIPIVILPLLAFAIAVVTQWMMLLISSAALVISGRNVWALWSQLSIFEMWIMLLFHFLCIHGLWQSPIYGWLLLISGWAKRAPILWAVLPPLAIGFGEKVAFNTTHFGSLIGNRFTGGSEGAAIMEQGRAMGPSTILGPSPFPHQSRIMDRPCVHRGIPRRSHPHPQVSRADLIRIPTSFNLK